MCLIESYIEDIILRICITHCIYNIYIYIFGIDILSNQCCTCKESDGNNWPLRSESYLHLNSKLLINPANYVSFSFIYKKYKQTTQTIIILVGQAGVFCVKIAGNWMVPRLFCSHLIVVWSCKSEKWVKVVGTTNSSFVLTVCISHIHVTQCRSFDQICFRYIAICQYILYNMYVYTHNYQWINIYI